MDKMSTRTMVKIGIVVDDLDAAIAGYVSVFGAEAAEVAEHPPFKDESPVSQPANAPFLWFRGRYIEARIRTAVIRLEPIHIELIEVIGEDGPWQEYKEKHGQGVQYMAYNIEGFDEHLRMMEQKGFPAFFKQEKGRERYAYFDTYDALGITMEMKEIDGSK